MEWHFMIKWGVFIKDENYLCTILLNFSKPYILGTIFVIHKATSSLFFQVDLSISLSHQYTLSLTYSLLMLSQHKNVEAEGKTSEYIIFVLFQIIRPIVWVTSFRAIKDASYSFLPDRSVGEYTKQRLYSLRLGLNFSSTTY